MRRISREIVDWGSYDKCYRSADKMLYICRQNVILPQLSRTVCIKNCLVLSGDNMYVECSSFFMKTKKSSNRYYQMIIRFCLFLASKAAPAYDELRSSNVLTLPSRRKLRDYNNEVKLSNRSENIFNSGKILMVLCRCTTPDEDYLKLCLLFW